MMVSRRGHPASARQAWPPSLEHEHSLPTELESSWPFLGPGGGVHGSMLLLLSSLVGYAFPSARMDDLM